MDERTAWIKIEGADSSLIRASLESQHATFSCIGSVIAKQGCWSFIKGGFVLDSPSDISLLLFKAMLFIYSTLINNYIFF